MSTFGVETEYCNVFINMRLSSGSILLDEKYGVGDKEVPAFAGMTISWLVFRPSPESEVIHYIRACFRYHLVRFRRRPESPLPSSHALVILAKARTSFS